MIKTLDLQRNITAYLENAFGIGYEKVSNQIWSASFSLPINDPKVSKVQLLKYVDIDDVGLFRIIPKQTSKSSNAVTFQCEHVLATLLNSTLFKYHQVTNYTTRESLQYLIDQQKEKHWKLGVVEFTRYFHYSWENENLLSAIISIPKGFDEQYRWTWDTSSYPWTLNLVKPETEPTCRVREGHNLIDFTLEENPMSIYNRIYPLGAGEGVNQLTIESVNNGIPYIEDAESIAENGIIETPWVDKRFEDADSLKANAEALLQKWKEPIVTWKVSAADVSKLTGTPIDELKEGKVVRLELDNYPVTDLRIMKETKRDTTGKPWDVRLQIGNLSEDLSTTNADLQRRQQVNELYSQGATNILNADNTENADPTHPIKFKIRIPADAVNINFMELTYDTDYFRGYTKGISAGGGFTKESTVSTKTTASGGGQTTSSGGGQTSSAGGDHYHVMFQTTGNAPGTVEDKVSATTRGGVVIWLADGTPTMTNVSTLGASGDHTHKVDDHTHEVEDHVHEFEIPIPAIEIPEHEHPTEYGIYEHNKMPTALEIKVDGTIIPQTSLSGENIELTPYLLRDSNGKIQRNRFAEIEIKPLDELAQISVSVIWGLFIRSHKGSVL